MGLAFDLSVNLGFCAHDDAAKCKAHLRAVGLPTGQADLAAGNAVPSKLIAHMNHDKKMRDGRMHFILVNTIGDAFVSGDVPPNAVETLLKRGANAV